MLERWEGARRSTRWITGLALLGVGLRFGVAVVARNAPARADGVGDPGSYLLLARHLASGRGYVTAQGLPEFEWPPLYPAFLSIVVR